MRAALWGEVQKFLRAKVPVATGVMLVVGIGVLCTALLFAVDSDDPQLVAKLGPLIDPGGWVGYLATASQVTSIAGLFGFGVVLSWSFGREFSDGTVHGLFALPVGRGTIAGAKLIVFGVWSLLVSLALLAMLVGLGFAVGLGQFTDATSAALATQLLGAILTSALATPVAWAATLGRGLLAGIATIAGIVLVSQVAVLTGVGPWFPFAAVGLYATGAPVSAGQLALVAPVAALFVALVVVAWRRLQLDR